MLLYKISEQLITRIRAIFLKCILREKYIVAWLLWANKDTFSKRSTAGLIGSVDRFLADLPIPFLI